MVKYLLSLCIVLLSGYGHLSARGGTDSIHVIIKHLKGIEPLGEEMIQNTEDLCIIPSFSAEKQNYRINVLLFENEENDELSAFRKYSENDNYSTSIFTALTPAIVNHSKKITPFLTSFSYTTSSRYLVFQVFRI